MFPIQGGFSGSHNHTEHISSVSDSNTTNEANVMPAATYIEGRGQNTGQGTAINSRTAEVVQVTTQVGEMAVQNFIYALITGAVEMVCSLLQSYSSMVNFSDDNGYTPLHTAFRQGNAAMAEALIWYGADMNARTADGKRPIDVAWDAGHIHMLSFLTPLDKFAPNASRLKRIML